MPKEKLTCWDAALKLLARRDYFVKEMAGKLKDKGYQGFEIAKTITALQDKGWLDDAKFARNRARGRAESSGWGVNRIRLELRQKGIEPALIDDALSTLETEDDGPSHDFQESAIDLLQRRFGDFPQTEAPSDFSERQTWLKQKEKEKKRRLDFLLRRGFAMQEALKALAAQTDLSEP